MQNNNLKNSFTDGNEMKQECIAQTYFDFHGQDILVAGNSSSCERFGSRVYCACNTDYCNHDGLYYDWFVNSEDWK